MVNLYTMLNRFHANKGSILDLPYKTMRLVLVLVANIYGRIVYNPLYSRRRIRENPATNDRIIISLTSFPGRIKLVPYVIETLFAQNTKPDRIILYLATSQFPDREHGLPKSLQQQKRRGLEIVFCDDLRSHKKYYYAFRDFADEIVVTVDDDVFYPKNTLTSLYQAYLDDPRAVACNRGKRITVNKGKLEAYNTWPRVIESDTGLDIIPIGIGGVLYPPRVFDGEVLNKEVFMKYAFKADDIWLKVQAMRNQVSTVKTAFPYRHMIDVLGSQHFSLHKENVSEAQNDVQLEALIEYYGLRIQNVLVTKSNGI